MPAKALAILCELRLLRPPESSDCKSDSAPACVHRERERAEASPCGLHRTLQPIPAGALACFALQVTPGHSDLLWPFAGAALGIEKGDFHQISSANSWSAVLCDHKDCNEYHDDLQAARSRPGDQGSSLRGSWRVMSRRQFFFQDLVVC